jgi:TetR/AcrR family transcriptional regulator, transcriptional repressor of bet genes
MGGRRASAAERREEILLAAFEVAGREGIGCLTLRSVAAQADLSHSLVLFHFKRKDRLVHALLEWLIATTSVLHVPEEVALLPRPVDRLQALLEQEMRRHVREPRRTRIFFEFWALGTRDDAIGAKIGAELERHREGFRTIMEELLLREPNGLGGATTDGLAGLAASWIHGCAVQAMIAPGHFETTGYLESVREIVGQLARGGEAASGGVADQAIPSSAAVVRGREADKG